MKNQYRCHTDMALAGRLLEMAFMRHSIGSLGALLLSAGLVLGQTFSQPQPQASKAPEPAFGFRQSFFDFFSLSRAPVAKPAAHQHAQESNPAAETGPVLVASPVLVTIPAPPKE